MVSTLRRIEQNEKLILQIVATGMHLDRRHGRSIEQIRKARWKIDAVIPWPADKGAAAMGSAIADLSKCFARLKSDIVLVVGDRVEAFAAAAAAHIDRRIVAHVHGGDRAQGQIDDSLRHATSKLAHIHFPATQASKARLIRMGEDKWRCTMVGSPGLDGLVESAAPPVELQMRYPGLAGQRYALVLLHPTNPDEKIEFAAARRLHKAIMAAGIDQLFIVGPNNDPGNAGIIRYWETLTGRPGIYTEMDLPRPIFLGLMRDAGVLVGNSSSGIIEAASFGTPVLDVGDRQRGRQCGNNVTTALFGKDDIQTALSRIWRDGRPIRYRSANIYGRGNAGESIATVISTIPIDDRLRRKLIAY